MKIEKCQQTPPTTDPETQNFALLTNGMLRTIPFQNCLSGRILILGFQPEEEWNEMETEIPDYKKWQCINNHLKLQSSQQFLTSEDGLITMKPSNLNSKDQLWLFQNEVVGSTKNLLELKKPHITNDQTKTNFSNQTPITSNLNLSNSQDFILPDTNTNITTEKEFYSKLLNFTLVLENKKLIKKQMQRLGVDTKKFDNFLQIFATPEEEKTNATSLQQATP